MENAFKQRILSSRKILIFTFAVLVIGGFSVWNRWSQPLGEQTVAYTPSSKQCFDGDEKKTWRYCVHTTPNMNPNRTAYFFHGRNLDENSWNDSAFYTGMVQKYWQENNLRAPKVISISFGSVWVLTPKMTEKNSGLLDRFVKEVLPKIELQNSVPMERYVFGESMGGLNSLLLGFGTRDLIHGVAALCPAVYSISPFSNSETVKSFLKRTGADPKLIVGLRTIAGTYVSTEEEWKRVSPLAQIETFQIPHGFKFYLSSGLYDKYGNFEGNELLAQKAKFRGIETQWVPLYGGHCAIDISSLAQFLAL